jgi:hypothetical protein
MLCYLASVPVRLITYYYVSLYIDVHVLVGKCVDEDSQTCKVIGGFLGSMRMSLPVVVFSIPKRPFRTVDSQTGQIQSTTASAPPPLEGDPLNA